MKYTYKFVTGESVGIEVSAELEALLKNEDRLEYNNEQTNRTRAGRFISLNMAENDEGMQFPDPNSDVAEIAIQNIDAADLHAAIGCLFPQQRELLQKVYFVGRSYAEIAREENVGESAIRDRMHRILKKLQKSLQ